MPEIADALADVGIETAFPIQELTLPVALSGTDLIGQARTGTGKTFAFAIPVIQRITFSDDSADKATPARSPQALIVTPTRELALQVAKDIDTASAHRGTRNLCIYGGVPYETQLDALDRGIDIVTGTPGRILDLINRGSLDVSAIRTVVLDEADEMLDLGFLPDVESILSQTPASRQTMLFSATMPPAIVTLARRHLTQPMNIRAESRDSGQMVPATAQFVWQAHEMDKPEVVARILQAKDVGRVIVFTRTKRAAQRVADDLAERGFPAAPLHGDMAQKARERALQDFRDGKVNILVATDVAARGIDVAGITHVINYTCPEDDKTYVHRIGRTGRAGATGVAVTFVDWADLSRWKLINAALELPFAEPVETYSTSEHLFTELNIDPSARGRTASAAKSSSSDRQAHSNKERSGRNGSGSNNRNSNDRKSRSEQTGDRDQNSSGANKESESSTSAAKRRRRRRTRSGSPVDSGNATQNSGNAEQV